jgi:hypothetical protein
MYMQYRNKYQLFNRILVFMFLVGSTTYAYTHQNRVALYH